MKKLIAIFIISLIGFSSTVDARGSSGGRSSGGRSSARSISTTKSTATTTPAPATTRTSSSSSTYRTSMFSDSLMGSVVGTVAGNMIYSSLSSGQRYGEYVNDGSKQYQQILSSTGALVGYQEVPVENKGIGWFWWLVIISIGVFAIIKITSFN